MKPICELLTKMNIKYNDISLYETAFTHSSFNSDANTKHHDYERLEFLGDTVVGLVVAETSFKTYPEVAQGPLTKMKSALVSTASLARFSRELGFADYIKVGCSFTSDVSKADHLLEDVFEAFVGALYLDKGFEVAKAFVQSVFEDPIKNYDFDASVDYKSRLQEEMQAEHRESVVYEVIKETGPAHDRRFVVQVVFDGIVLGVGEGSSKKSAEQMAAKQALNKEANR